MLVLMAAPTLIMMYSTPSHRHVAVVDNSGIVMPALLQEGEQLSYVTLEASTQLPDSLMNNPDVDAVLYVGKDIVSNPSDVKLYQRDAGSIDLESTFRNTIKDAVEAERLKNYNIENLSEILDEIHADVHLQTIRVSDSGESESTSSMMSVAIGFAMTFILYMFLLIYGQMVMTSIIEEKNNRVLELVVSSVKPLQLMLGKIIGVGLVAVTQVVIWGALLCLMSVFLLPAIMPANLAQEVALTAGGGMDMSAATFDPDMLQALSLLSSVGYIAKMFAMMLLFLVGGFLFYAAIFAAIGSAVDNIQDASQLQTFAVVPILIALVVSLSVTADPNSTLAVWMSMIPLTSPMVMLARIPFDIASWQIWLSLILLYASFVAMAWLAAKIYRVGIFMYGKKPTIRDLIRWARYK